MKKIAASVGLIALGASTLHAAETSALNSMQQTKPWSISATLRGFYDDNTEAVTDGPSKNESAGFDITPSLRYGVVGEQTSFNVGYDFTARYFDKQAPGRVDKSDYTHQFNADLSHAFSPHMELTAGESFVIGQEPDLLRDPASSQPIEGDNIRNFANVGLTMDATELLGFGFGYNNSFYDYDDEAVAISPFGVVNFASNSGLYDRMEQALRLDSRWKLQPQTTGIIGYTYSRTDYSGAQPIAGNINIPGDYVMSDARNSVGHRFYVGADQVFSSTLSGSVRVGVEYTDYVNDPLGTSQWSPYFEGSLNYMFQTTTALSVGVRYNRAAANDAGGSGNTFVRDTQTGTVYGSVKQALASKMFLTANLTAQNSIYNAPGNATFDNESYLFYQMGLDLSYEFNPNLSAHVGYNYDKYDSTVPGVVRDYDRNRVYLGVTAGF